MSNIQGAIGVVQLKKLDRMNGLRRAHAQYLIEGLKDEERIDLPFESPDCKHVYQMFTIKLKDTNRDARDAFIWKLRDRNIEASVHFDPPLHQQEIYSEFRRDDLRVTDRVSQCIVTLPLFPGMSREMLDRVIDAVRSTVTELASRQF